MTTTIDNNDEAYYQAIGDFRPGSITKIKLVNFMTHSNVEILPGPRLNIVIGANGTGKSTILNAICLGLGGDPKMLGRADDLRAFVQTGKSVATIEIHLQPVLGQQEQAHVLTRIIHAHQNSRSRGRGSSTFYLNGQHVSMKQVRLLVSQTYQIAVDNLCTFLPQDKVGNFSGLTDQQRLLETEKTFGCLTANNDENSDSDDDEEDETSETKNLYYYNLHQELIQAEQELLSSSSHVETVQDEWNKLQHELGQLEREKERMEERQRAMDLATLYRQKKLWLQFEALREQAVELKDQKTEIENKVKIAHQSLRPLQQRAVDTVTARKRLEARLRELDKEIKSHKKEMEKQVQKYETHDEKIEDVLVQIQTLETRRIQLEKQLEHAQKHLEQSEQVAVMNGPEEEIESDFAQAQSDLKKARHDFGQAKRELRTKSEQFKEFEEREATIQSRLVKLNDGAARRKDKIFRMFPDVAKVCKWLDKNRKEFRRQVWGPIVCEVNPTSPNASAYLEFHVQNRVLKAFVVETDEDYDKLYHQGRKELKVPINVINVRNGRLKDLRRMYSDRKMNILEKEHGVAGYLDEYFTAPDPVMQALRDYGGVDRVLVGGEKTKDSIDHKELMHFLNAPDQWSSEPTKRKNGAIFSLKGKRKFRNLVEKSRYADSPNIRQDDVFPAKMLAPGTDERAQKECQDELSAVQKQINAFRPSLEEVQKKVTDLESIVQEANTKAQHNKKKKENWVKLQNKIKSARRKVQEYEEELEKDDTKDKKKYVSQLCSHTRHSITALAAHKDERRKMIDKTIDSAGALLGKSQSQAAERSARQALEEAKQEHDALKVEAKEIQSKFNDIRKRAKQAKDLADAEAPITDANGDPLPLKETLEGLEVTTLAEVEAALEDVEQTIEAIEANDNVLQLYANLKRDVARVEEQLKLVSSSKDEKLAVIAEKRKPWESALESNISRINNKFAEYMKEMGCTGEVRLKKGNANESRSGNSDAFADFKEWGIEIIVSYRENARAEILSAQHHSGGERSVATILYLMALQDLMIAPFRCVDEINQGLDERNERLVFSRIVANSTSPPKNNNRFDHSGQYFLITPKLLPHLTAMENEAVSIQMVFNGSYSFENPSDWNMENLLIRSNNDKRSRTDEAEGDCESSQDDDSAHHKSKKRRTD